MVEGWLRRRVPYEEAGWSERERRTDWLFVLGDCCCQGRPRAWWWRGPTAESRGPLVPHPRMLPLCLLRAGFWSGWHSHATDEFNGADRRLFHRQHKRIPLTNNNNTTTNLMTAGPVVPRVCICVCVCEREWRERERERERESV